MKNEIKKLLDICIVGGVYSWKKLPSLKRKKEKRCTCVKMKLRTASQAHHTTADMRFRSPRSLHPNCSPLRYEQLLISAVIRNSKNIFLTRKRNDRPSKRIDKLIFSKKKRSELCFLHFVLKTI